MTGLTPNHFPRFTTGLVAVVGILLALGRSQAADINPSILKLKANTFTSQCGQFTVIGHAPGSPLGPPSLSKIRGGYLQMDPALLLLTCEQIKTKLLGLLEGGDEWKGAITVFVQGKALASEPVQVNSQWYPHGWRFQIVVPGQVERKQLIRATVRALLLEMANRHNPTAGLAETPLWLQEGLAAQLFALHGTTLVPGNRTLTIQTETSVDVYREDRDHLRLFRPLDFAALSYPTQRQLTGLAWETFQKSSHLFVAELLQLPNSPVLCRKMLKLLPDYLNHQLAFLEAHRPLFKSMLDVEKWWSVVLVNFQSRDKNRRWSESQSIGRLEAILRQPVEVRLASNAVPTRTEMSLQELIDQTDYAEHKRVLLLSVTRLGIIQHHSQKDLARLILDYRRTLEDYMRKREEAPTTRSLHHASGRLALTAAIKNLNILDEIRRDIRLVATPDAPEAGLERVERLLRESGLP